MEKKIKLEITTRELSGLMTTVEQVRNGQLKPEKLKELLEPMKNKLKDTINNLPQMKDDLEKLKTEDVKDPVSLIEDGLNIYKKTLDMLSLFLTDSKKEHLDESLKTAAVAHTKFITIQDLISRVTGL